MAEHQTQSAAAIVTEYIQTRGPEMAELHDAFGIASSFDGSKSKLEDGEKHVGFVEALREYGKLEGDRLQFDPVACSWSDVLIELRKAQDAAAKCEQKDRGGFTKSRRTLSNMSKMIEPALQAFPDELGILHGGLGVVFNLAQRREETRRAILDVFEEIPGIIAMACSKSKNFPDNVKLRESLDDLKATLFDAIPKLVDVLLPGSLLAKLSPFRGFKAQELLDLIQARAKRVEACVGLLRDEIDVATYVIADKIYRTTTNTGAQVASIHESISTVHQGVRDLNDQYDGIDYRIIELAQHQSFISQQLKDALSGQNGMFQMLKEVVSVFLFEQESGFAGDRPKIPLEKASSSPGQRTALLQILSVEERQGIRDLDIVLRQSYEFDQAAKSYGAAILGNQRFQRWIASRGPDLIYVEGRLDSSKFGKTSPISYFGANVAQLFKDEATNLTLHFFCGQHAASNDNLCGPRGLIRSLLAQLIRRWPSATPMDAVNIAADFNGDYELIRTEDFCQLFEILLGQIPAHIAVLCIIDDIPRLERDHWQEDYWLLMEMLGRLVVGQTTAASIVRFRLLMTSPTRSKLLQNMVPPDSRVELTENDQFIGHRLQQSMWTAVQTTI